MKNIRNKAKTLLIIVLIAFVIIPYVTIQLEKVFKIEEGLAVNLKTSGENSEGITLGLKNDETDTVRTQIDRIKTTTDGKYKYCIGNVSCSSGDLVKEGTDAYMLSDGTKIGYTYQENCNDGSTPATCSGSSPSFSKFYGPFDGLPAVFQVSGNNLLISDQEPPASDSGGEEPPASDSGGEKDDDTQRSYDNLKCLADNGAVAGDELCCGQEGVVQNTKYNCPSEYPHCIGYKCGETWGRCSKTHDA
jgi:hypothetical protein